MKKIYSLLFICAATTIQAQNAIPNGNFEQWTSATYETPQFYPVSSNPETFFKSKAPFNCVKTTDSYSGTYALKLTTVAGIDTSMAYLLNADPGNGNNPCQWAGGIPYNQQAIGIRGHYKSNIMPGDSAGILMVFKNAGVCLGTYMFKFGGVQSTYIPFNFTFSPALASAPDSVIFAAVSSDVFNGIQEVGSMIQFDSLAFTGVASQPAQFNGDFETWQSVTLKSPDTWYLGSDDQGNGVSQTLDVYAGAYAIELTTLLGDNNGVPRANAGRVSTGYSICSQSGPCIYKGGHAFTNQIDTLAFYYKYAPSANDSANVNITFKKNGSQIFSTGKSIHTAGTYTYMEVPFNVGSAPDTVIVEFQSSNWNDTLLSFIGSVLKVDEVHFKSQPLSTGIKNVGKNNSISVYPNPSVDGVFYLNNVSSKDVINVYNILGEHMNTFIERGKENALIKIPSDTNGIYFIQVNSSGKVFTQKVIVGKQ